MPYRFETLKIPLPRKHDGRVKLTYAQRDEIKQNKLGLSNHALARRYKVSKRTIQFIRNPDSLEAVKRATLKRVEQAGGWRAYQSPYDMTGAIRATRQKKQKLMLSGELSQPKEAP